MKNVCYSVDMKPLLFALSWLALVGCSTTAILTPIEGPISQTGAPAISAKVNGIVGNSGTIETTLPSGEVCKGDWVAVRDGYQGSIVSGVARGDRGTVIDFEMRADSSARAVGTAKDNRGNKYRVIVKGL